jgi:hypothetical protein
MIKNAIKSKVRLLIFDVYAIFMYYYKFVNIVYDKIAYNNIIFTNLNLKNNINKIT